MLLAVNRMIEKDWSVSAADSTMGGYLVTDEQSPWYMKIPITPVMDNQLDQIIIQDFLLPLRTKLLSELQGKMEQGRKEDWFEVFLAVFILSTNTELLLRHSRKNAVRYGAKHRYNSIHLAEEYFHGTNILLAHFHYGHKGTTPLILLRDKKAARSIPGLQDHQTEFLYRLQRRIQTESGRLIALRSAHQYEADLFWSHQMFLQDWDPKDRSVVDEL